MVATTGSVRSRDGSVRPQAVSAGRRPNVRVAIVGKGKLGNTFAKALKMSKGYELTSHLSARSASFGALARDTGPDILLIACKDDAIEATTLKAMSAAGPGLKLIAHFSGSRPPEILPKRKGVARVTLHPLQTFATSDRLLFAGSTFMICTSDKEAERVSRKLATDLGASTILTLKPEQLPLYHAMAVFASNSITLIGGVIEHLGRELRLSDAATKKALTPILRQSLRNILANRSAAVLTGPIARKDERTIRMHLRTLAKVSPEIRNLYLAFVAFGKKST